MSIDELERRFKAADRSSKAPRPPAVTSTPEEKELWRQKYLKQGRVLASFKKDKHGRVTKIWSAVTDCVYLPPRGPYYRKLDFLERWARAEILDESRRFFPGGDMSRLVSLIGTEEGKREFARWEHHKDVLLDVAIQRCREACGRTFVRARVDA